jgi:hypothetical protein
LNLFLKFLLFEITAISLLETDAGQHRREDGSEKILNVEPGSEDSVIELIEPYKTDKDAKAPPMIEPPRPNLKSVRPPLALVAEHSLCCWRETLPPRTRGNPA